MKYWIGTRLLCNVVIFHSASNRLPEFQGYQEKPFPGQPKPLRAVPIPRREALNSDFEVEWKKMASKTIGTVQIRNHSMIRGSEAKNVDCFAKISI